MILNFILGATLVIVTIAEIVLPGNALYHYGWFNVVLAALLAWLLVRARSHIAVPIAGAAIAAFATIASGLLGPDTQLVVASPGEIAHSVAGDLAFPLDVAQAAVARRTYRGAFVLDPMPRTVVRIEASDARGGSLTITQPTGEAFLSPVLLLKSNQSIDGMNLPFDSFAVPALHRQIKAVLFDPSQSSRMASLIPGYNVLFDVTDDAQRQVPHGIGVAHDGQTVTLGGVRLRPTVLSYDAVRIISIPDVRIAGLGVFLAIGGVIGLAILTRRRSAV